MNRRNGSGRNTVCSLLLGLALPVALLAGPVCMAEERIVLPEGTRIVLQLNKSLSTRENNEGDSFDAYVIEPVYQGGRIAIPKGSVISGSISRITRPGRFKGKAVIRLLFRSIDIPGRGRMRLLASLARIDSDDAADARTNGTPASRAPAEGGAGKAAGAGPAAADPGTAAGQDLEMADVFWTRDRELEIHRGTTMEIRLGQRLEIPSEPSGAVSGPLSLKLPQPAPAA